MSAISVSVVIMKESGTVTESEEEERGRIEMIGDFARN